MQNPIESVIAKKTLADSTVTVFKHECAANEETGEEAFTVWHLHQHHEGVKESDPFGHKDFYSEESALEAFAAAYD